MNFLEITSRHKVSPWLLLLLWLAGGFALGVAILNSQTPVLELTLDSPNPLWSPADVVRTQLSALRRSRRDPAAMAECFALASPDNRAVTGPLERFTQMVNSPTYSDLIEQREASLGTPQVQGQLATVLASVIGPNQRVSLFRFYLSRQSSESHGGCWLTDAVIREAAETPPPLPQSIPTM